MFSKRNIVLGTAAVAAAVLLVVTQRVSSDQGANKLAGSWVARVAGTPWQWTYTISPSDPSGKQAAIWGEIQVKIPNNEWFKTQHPELFANQEYLSSSIGEVVMTGPDTARFTSVWYGLQSVDFDGVAAEKVVNIGVTTGDMKFLAPGKLEASHHMAIYTPEQDADGDGFPDAGQVPALCLPEAKSLDTRLGLIPPCTPAQ